MYALDCVRMRVCMRARVFESLCVRVCVCVHTFSVEFLRTVCPWTKKMGFDNPARKDSTRYLDNLLKS